MCRSENECRITCGDEEKAENETKSESAEGAVRDIPGLYEGFLACTVGELEGHILSARTREERIFYRTLLNLRLRLDQEKIVGKSLL